MCCTPSDSRRPGGRGSPTANPATEPVTRTVTTSPSTVHDANEPPFAAATRAATAHGSPGCELVTNDSGGWASPEGIALGFDADGNAVLDGQDEVLVPALNLAPAGRLLSHPLARHTEIAPTYAGYAQFLLPAVDDAFEIGANLERALAALDSNPDLSGPVGRSMKLALGLLWVAEEVRRQEAV